MRISDHNYALLLSGGSGTRFWPLSRRIFPKQFLLLYQKKSLFDLTLKRIKTLFLPQNIFIATGEMYRGITCELIASRKIPPNNVICEPSSKNTAPSIGICVRSIMLKDPKARIAVLPCDHLIQNAASFTGLLKQALSACDKQLIVFGIAPTRPATGYGYIKVQSAKSKAQNKKVLEVEKFLEKPDLATAKNFMKDKRYFWNSGMFIGSADIFMEKFKAHLPALYNLLLSMRSTKDVVRIWERVKPVSFDYGILEKASGLGMLAAKGLGWSDVGSWQAYDESLIKDINGNCFDKDVIGLETRNTTVIANNRKVALIGVEGLVVVATPDAVLIAKKSASEKVKLVVEKLKRKNAKEL